MKTQTTKGLKWELQTQDDIIRIHLMGEFTRDTLLALDQQRTTLMNKITNYAQICWDLSEITRIDSAGFALLCEVLHQCQNRIGQSDKNIKIKVIHCPTQLLTLSDLFGLSRWLQQFLNQPNNNMEIQNGNSRN